MCLSDWECDCHMWPQVCPSCDGTGESVDDPGEPCSTCDSYEHDDEPEFDPHAADRMADRADDARWARMP